MSADSVVNAVAAIWAALLVERHLLRVNHWVSREAFYRLAIPDYMSASRRAQILGVLEAASAAAGRHLAS